MPHVLWCVTSPVTARAFLRGHLQHMESRGIRTTLVCGDDGTIGEEFPSFEPWTVDREPSALADLRAARDLTRILRRLRPDTVVLGTPKAGLLGMLAAVATRVPRRIYVVHGLRYEGFTGWRRRVFQAFEVLVASGATQTVAVSPSVAASLRSFLPPLPRRRVRVIAHGSADGVDPSRFRPATADESRAVRRRLGLPADKHVVLFVGRLTGDKGLSALVRLAAVLETRSDTVLVLIGEPEPRTATEEGLVDLLTASPAVRHESRSDEVETWLRAADVLAQPTRREGMPNVILEAQFSGLAVVSCAVTGVVDAVEHDVTGVLVPWGDDGAFVDAVLDLLADPGRRLSLTQQARSRALARFDQKQVRDCWARFLLEEA
ncbi:glycosyltransferase [Ornithinimicrobium avium]|nr:glycosyltransferase [Ornithinimicrobium avium]